VPSKLSAYIGLCLSRMVTKIGGCHKSRFASLAGSDV
jgi:hypothetical protein